MSLNYVSPSGEILRPKPIDQAKLVAAYRTKAARSQRPKPQPTEPSPTLEACVHCGIPGGKGCDHWLPFEAQPSPVPDKHRKYPPRHKFVDFEPFEG